MSYQLFSESLTFAERLSIASALKRQLAQVEAEVAEGIGRTQVVIAEESFDGNFVADAPRIVGATHSLTIAYEDMAVTAHTAFLEYGAVGEAAAAVYVLKTQLSRFVKRNQIAVSGFVKVGLGFGNRLTISFHGKVGLGEMGEAQFRKTVAEHLFLSGKQVVLWRHDG